MLKKLFNLTEKIISLIKCNLLFPSTKSKYFLYKKKTL